MSRVEPIPLEGIKSITHVTASMLNETRLNKWQIGVADIISDLAKCAEKIDLHITGENGSHAYITPIYNVKEEDKGEAWRVALSQQGIEFNSGAKILAKQKVHGRLKAFFYQAGFDVMPVIQLYGQSQDYSLFLVQDSKHTTRSLEDLKTLIDEVNQQIMAPKNHGLSI